MTRRKYTFKTFAEYEAKLERIERYNNINTLALNCLGRGEVQWLYGTDYDLGFCSLLAGHGGVAILKFHPSANPKQKASFAAYYLDEALAFVKDWTHGRDRDEMLRNLQAALDRREQLYDEQAAA